MEESYQQNVPILTIGQDPNRISCINFRNGKCLARRNCASIAFATQNSSDRLVQQGRQIALEIVKAGATFETEDEECGAPSPEAAERRCRGFL